MTGVRAARRPIRAVVFDLDGVLIDSLEVMREAFTAAHAEVVGPGPAPFEEFLSHLGRHLPDIMRIMGLPVAMQDPFVRVSRELADRVKPCDGAGDLLRDLRSRGIPMAVATGKVTHRAEFILDLLGLRPLLDAVLGSDAVSVGKPAPDLVLAALRRIDRSPDEAVMVGDSVLDLAAGRAAGTLTAAATWGQGDPDELRAKSPDLVATSCADLGLQLEPLIG